ncbi:MAG: hypothetical protein GYA76_14425 [Verrucomicrobia bacterium]|jgi:hypothetical protein|nr:hypothetical protein [Verrucomicrobiota bacterium]
MIRLLVPLLLCGCISDGYVMRSVGVNAAPGSVGVTLTFDNIYLPQTGGTCVEVCVAD